MSRSIKPVTEQTSAKARARRLRIAIYLIVAAQALIYLYLYVYIGRHANPMGDGLEWVAIVPATLVLAIGTAPALALSAIKRWLPAGVALAIVGLALNIGFFVEIARELGGSKH